jgi:hypothetical protein
MTDAAKRPGPKVPISDWTVEWPYDFDFMDRVATHPPDEPEEPVEDEEDAE